jgi:hypothetical protein
MQYNYEICKYKIFSSLTLLEIDADKGGLDGTVP